MVLYITHIYICMYIYIHIYMCVCVCVCVCVYVCIIVASRRVASRRVASSPLSTSSLQGNYARGALAPGLANDSDALESINNRFKDEGTQRQQFAIDGWNGIIKVWGDYFHTCRYVQATDGSTVPLCRTRPDSTVTSTPTTPTPLRVAAAAARASWTSTSSTTRKSHSTTGARRSSPFGATRSWSTRAP